MSDVIRFLEGLGAQPSMSADHYAAAVAELDVGPEPKQALLARDSTALNGLLDGRARMICMVATPQPDQLPDRSPDEQEGEEAPAEEDGDVQ